MLACTRIGAPHTIVFGGFSPESLSGRINDADAKVVVTADGGWRRGGIVPLKQNVDDALKDCPSVSSVVVVRRIGEAAQIHMQEKRDLWWHDLMQDAPLYCPPEEARTLIILTALFLMGRVLFWVGYHYNPYMRAFGFGITFYPTVAVYFWLILRMVFGITIRI